MKRYGNLYTKIYDLDNIYRAHINARRGKAHYHEVQMVNANSEKYLLRIQDMLKNKTFVNSKYITYIKLDNGKEREIFKLPYFPDRIIHHCIVQILEPIWMKTLITDTYSSLKNRGVHKGVNRIKRALIDRENTQYCLKMDVRKFYPSINHDILKSIIRTKIKDSDVLWILDTIIDSTKGVPIGNYLSQYFGNIYLSGFDHYMKEQMQCKYYFRYCDDIVILDSDKAHLADLRVVATNYIESELNLKLKDNWQVFSVDIRGIDFLGYRFFHDYTLLRKSISTKFKHTIVKINTVQPKHSNIVNQIMSYDGWMKPANCYNLKTRYLNNSIHNIVSDICIATDISNPLRDTVRI